MSTDRLPDPLSGGVRFSSAVDNWLLAVLVGSGIISVASILITASHDPRGAALALLSLGLIAVLVGSLALPMYYTVGDTDLLIRSGFIRVRVPLNAIVRVYPTRNPLGAPAMSLNRLGIVYLRGRRRGLALISPREREHFLDLLGRRAGLERVGRELHRTGPDPTA